MNTAMSADMSSIFLSGPLQRNIELIQFSKHVTQVRKLKKIHYKLSNP